MFDKVIKLTKGAGNGINSACLMTASNMLIGKGEKGDEVTCQCSLIRTFVITTNDSMPSKLRCKLYSPLIYEIIGTKTTDPDVIQQRAFAFADWAVREIAPLSLRAIGLKAQGELLEALDPICCRKTAMHAAAAAFLASSDAVRQASSDVSFTRICSVSSVCNSASSSAAFSSNAGPSFYSTDAAGHAAAAASTLGNLNQTAADNVWSKCPDIIRRVASIGDKRPVEAVMSIHQLQDALI
tara:strand:+ start:2785 stop:3504 length:720 start_codon:yes stop_codon:yes gene_type:complete